MRLLILLVGFSFTFCLFSCGNNKVEPKYQNKSLAEWEEQLLNDNDPNERRRAIDGIIRVVIVGKGKNKSTAVKTLILSLQKEKSEDMKFGVVDALKHFKDHAAVPVLIQTLKNDKSEFVRFSSADALSKIGSKVAIPALIDAMRADKSNSVRETAKKALQKISGKNFDIDVFKWEEWWEKNKDRILKEEAEKDRLEKEKSEKE